MLYIYTLILDGQLLFDILYYFLRFSIWDIHNDKSISKDIRTFACECHSNVLLYSKIFYLFSFVLVGWLVVSRYCDINLLVGWFLDALWWKTIIRSCIFNFDFLKRNEYSLNANGCYEIDDRSFFSLRRDNFHSISWNCKRSKNTLCMKIRIIIC